MDGPLTAALERLIAHAPPPAAPTAAAGDFAAVEADLGTPLPAEYKDLVHRYGYGSFGDFLHLWSPFFAECTMMSQARGALDADRQLAKVAPKAVPFPLFPEPDGALPWASTDNGDVLYFLTWGEPDAWPVAIWNPRAGDKYDLVDGGAAECLVQWLSGKPKLARLEKPEVACFDRWIARSHEVIPLSPSTQAFDARLAALVSAFDDVQMRGRYGDEESDKQQVHFVAENGAIRVTYDTVYGHNVRLAAPADGFVEARARVASAARVMGSEAGSIKPV